MAASYEENEQLMERFYAALGRYVAAVSNGESLFVGFLVLAMNDETDADASLAIWFQFQSTRARLEMVRNTVRAVFGSRAPAKHVTQFIARFKGLSRQRNYYAHAHYHPNLETGVYEISGYEVTEGQREVVKAIKKVITKGTCNEITRSCDQLDELNLEMWKYLSRLQKQLMRERGLQEQLIAIPTLSF